MWGLNLGLCAVNLAEASGEATPSTTVAEIYISTALRITVGRFKFLAVRHFKPFLSGVQYTYSGHFLNIFCLTAVLYM